MPAATDKCTSTHAHEGTHTHTHNEKRKRQVIVLLGEGVTKRAVSGPCSMFCHHVVTKCARGTKRVGCASNLTHFVTFVTKRAATNPTYVAWNEVTL